MIRKFISEVILLLAIISSLCAFLKKLITTRIRDKNAYIATTLDKEKRLTELPFNKLIFVGGSNLTFGLDCKKISDSIKMPTVNMSVHAGLGLDFMLKETMASIKQGDVIILSPEYYLGKDGDRKLFAQLLDINPQASKYVINTFNDNIRLLVAELQRCVSGLFYTFITNPSPSVYEKNNFTEEGDMVGHLEIANSTSLSGRGKMLISDYNNEIISMNKFITYANSVSAKVYYAFPCFSKSEYQLNKDALDNFCYQMRAKLNCDIINTPETFLFQDEYFFDTVYHLNKKGREIRTNTMISILKNRLK